MKFYGVTYYDLTIKNEEFKRSLNNALFVNIRQAVLNTVQPLEKRLKVLIKTTLIESPEVQSMLGGTLAADFGFVKGREASYIMPIIDWIIDRVRVLIVGQFGNKLGGFDVELAVFPLDSLTRLPTASYDSNGFDIQWLSWLFAGGGIINREYRINYGNYIGKNAGQSRSQQAIMVKSFKGWRVPAEYVGTEQYNWITNALYILQPQILFMMEDELSKQIGRL